MTDGLTPVEGAARWWREHSTEGFEERVAWHFACGLVWSSPVCFMLAHEVYWDVERGALGLNGEAPNAWFVELAVVRGGRVNPVRECMRVAPWRHRYAAWCRRGEFRVKVFDWEKLSRKVGLN